MCKNCDPSPAPDPGPPGPDRVSARVCCSGEDAQPEVAQPEPTAEGAGSAEGSLASTPSSEHSSAGG